MIKPIALLVATTFFFATPVAAENLTDLIALADKLNELCRGLPGDTPHLDDICDARIWLSRHFANAVTSRTAISEAHALRHGALIEIAIERLQSVRLVFLN